jgi:hypothetical protein
VRIGAAALLVFFGCGAEDAAQPYPDAARSDAARDPDGPDSAPLLPDAATATAGDRDRLFAGYAEGDSCTVWTALDDSQRAVFLTLTHRLSVSMTPDGQTMLSHVDAVYLILGGGADGTACGSGENNRLFVSMDRYLWERMVDAWNNELAITDGGGAYWAKTNDIAGPHDPFDASSETQSGLSCALVVELPDSKPPTAQAHLFRDGSATRVERGPGISLDADPHMLEIDHDFDCFHQSNPTCGDFAQRYVDNYGDYGADWTPAGC